MVFTIFYLTDKEIREKEKEKLKEELQRTEERANSYFHKFSKLQGDYHNLIGIAAELVDSLEKCVRGQMVSENKNKIKISNRGTNFRLLLPKPLMFIFLLKI